MKKAIYPGSFETFHKGHQSVVEKGLKLFDEILIVVTINPDKKIVSDFETRKDSIEKLYSKNKKIRVLINDKNFTAEFAKKNDVNYIIRSFRNEYDFNYEIDLAFNNKILNKNLETILLFPEESLKELSSTYLRHKKFLENN